MKRQNSISPSEFTNLLQAGALLRKDSKWLLYACRWKSAFGEKNPVNTVSCVHFYDSSQGLFAEAVEEYSLDETQLREALLSLLGESPRLNSLSQMHWQEPQKEDFRKAFELIQKRIESSEIQKAVPVVFASADGEMSVENLALLILKLIEAPPHLWVAGIWNKNQGIIAATPEVLFHQRGSVLETMALAGTMPKGESGSRTALLEDLKEVDEHSFVVDDLEKVLRQWGAVGVQGPQVVEFPTLYHLQTLLQVQLKASARGLNFVSLLHPTPALGVAPRGAGYHWMQTLPGQEERKFFGAPLTFQWEDESLSLVMIRSLQWGQGKVHIGSGCGIVSQSELEREWQELFHKRESVKKILGLSL